MLAATLAATLPALLSLASPALAAPSPDAASADAPSADPASSDAPSSRRPLDYTAWSMAPGEVRVGLTRLDVGVLPKLQVGTQTGLDLLGVYNVAAQWSPLDRDGRGLAVGASFHDMPVGDFHLRHSRVDLTGSRQLGTVGLHGGLAWTRLTTGGSPDPDKLSPVLKEVLGVAAAAGGGEGEDVDSRLDTIRLRAAVDLRLAEHHALVGQLSMALAQDKRLGQEVADLGQGLPDNLGLSRTLDPDHMAGPSDSYAVSLAWQGSWRNLQLRAGLGLSADPYAWLLQSTELSWRFGGRRQVVAPPPVADANADEQGRAGEV